MQFGQNDIQDISQRTQPPPPPKKRGLETAIELFRKKGKGKTNKTFWEHLNGLSEKYNFIDGLNKN